MSTANRVIKNTFWLYAKIGITMFVSLYTTRLILNGLGATDFGIFNIVGGAIAMLGFLNSAMASATQRFMSYAEGEGKKEKQKIIFNISFTIHLSLSLIVGLFLLCAGFVFFNGLLNIPEDRISAAIVVYGSLILSTMLTVTTVPYDAVMNAHENIKYYAFVGILESLLKLAVAFACIYTKFDKLIVYGILMACIPFITLTIMRVYCHRNYEECVISVRKYYDSSTMKEMIRFAGWNFMGSATSMICNYGQGIIVNHFFGVILNAAIGIANQVQGQLLVLSNNMQKALNPVIVKKAGANENNEMIEWCFTGCKFAYLMLAWIAIPVFVEATYILEIWLTEVPEWTILFLRLMLIRTGIELMYSNVSASLNAVGKNKQLNVVNSLFFVTSLVATIVLFSFGCPPYALFIVMIIMVLTQAFFSLRLSHKYAGISIRRYINKVAIPLISITLITAILGELCRHMEIGNLQRICIDFPIMIIIFLSGSYLIVLNKREKDVVITLMQKVISINKL